MAGVSGRSGGHNAKTVAQHLLEGTHQKVRHAGIKNPEPPAGEPVPPKKLTGDAKDEWKRMIERLRDCKILAAVDGAAIYQYCLLFAETEELATKQEEIGAALDVLEQSLGDFKGPELIACFQEMTKMRALESRYTTQIRQGRMGLRVFLVEFGLTPASRGRVRLPEQKPEAESWDALDGVSVQ